MEKSTYFHRTKKLKSLLLALFFAANIFSPFLLVQTSFAASDYVYVNAKTIRSNSKKIEYQWTPYTDIAVKVVAHGGTGCPDGGLNDCLYFKSDTTEDPAGIGIISASVKNPSKARHDIVAIMGPGSSVIGGDGNITVNGADQAQAAKADKITNGGIYLAFKQLGDWRGNDFNERVNEASVGLRHDSGLNGTASGEDIEVERKSNGGKEAYVFIQLTNSNFLYSGLNRFSFERKVDVNCDDGNMNRGAPGLDRVCTATIGGTVNFKLEPTKNGAAKIIIVGGEEVEKNSPANGMATNQIGENGPAIVMGVTYKLSSPLDGILEQAMSAVLDFISGAIKAIGGWINSMLNFGNDINNPGMIAVWTKVRNISLSLLTLGILIIAFANILNLNLEKYGVNRMIPRLVMAVVMTYFSFVILRFLLEVTSALQALALSGNSLDMANLGNGKFSAAFNGDIGQYSGAFGLLILLFFLGFIIVVAMLWLLIILTIRIAVIWFLVALAPIAFLMMIMPFTESLYQQWWAKFWKWAFMGPAIAFMLFMTNEFLTIGFGTSFAANCPKDQTLSTLNNMCEGARFDQPASWIFLILAAAGIFIAASLPMTMGGDVFSGIKSAWGSIKGAGKFADKLTGNRVGARMALRKSTKEGAMKLKAQQGQAKWAQRGFWGRRVAGANKAQARMLDENLVSSMAQERGMTNMKEDDARELLTNRNIYVARAAARELASRKRLAANIKNSDQATRVTEMLDQDATLYSKVAVDNKDAYAALTLNGQAAKWQGEAEKAMLKTPLKEWGGDQWKMANHGTFGKNSREMIRAMMQNRKTREDFYTNSSQSVQAALHQVLHDNEPLRDEINRHAASISDPEERGTYSQQVSAGEDALNGFVASQKKGPFD